MQGCGHPDSDVRLKMHVFSTTSLIRMESNAEGNAVNQAKQAKQKTQNDRMFTELEVYRQDFQFTKLMGTGAFSKVFEVVSKKDHKKYAMKIIDLKEQPLPLCEKEREMLTQGQGHQNIVQIVNFKQPRTESFYIIMYEYVQGEDLINSLPKVAQDEEKVVSIWRQLLGAVAHLHSKGLTHRDIKLDNILYTDEGKAVLMDFGFACETKNNEGQRCGSKMYAAPELWRTTQHGDKAIYDEKVDIWAVGRCIYMLATGKTFPPGSIEKAVQDLSFSPEFKNLLMKFLHEAPEQRISANDALKNWIFMDQQQSKENVARNGQNMRPEPMTGPPQILAPLQYAMQHPHGSQQQYVGSQMFTQHPHFMQHGHAQQFYGQPQYVYPAHGMYPHQQQFAQQPTHYAYSPPQVAGQAPIHYQQPLVAGPCRQEHQQGVAHYSTDSTQSQWQHRTRDCTDGRL